MRVAIVDFDGTLYAGETFNLLMKYLKEHPELHTNYKSFFRKILPLYIGYKLKLVPEAIMKERSMQLYLAALKDLSQSDLKKFFEGLSSIIQQDFNTAVIDSIQSHLNDNVHVMLVSGAFTPMLQSVASQLNFNTIIGTDIPLKDNKIDFTKPLRHIQGIRKNEMILQELTEQNIDWKNSYAYSDSLSDLPVLELVGNPVAVSPEPKLRALANRRKWTVL